MTSSEATVDPALDFDRIELSAFPHARTATPRPKPVTLAQFLDAIEHGRYAKVVEQARTLYAQYKAGQIDKSVYQTFKERRLEAVTMARFHTKRQARYLRMHHGLVVGDADDLDDPDAIRTRLQDDPHVVAMFLSPGGSGLKIIARIPPQDAAGHRRAFHAFADYLGARYGVILDRRGQDVNRLCYISADPHVYRNPAAVPLILPAQTRSQTHRRTGEKPGDALNTTADAVWWQDLLERHGWAVADAEPPDHHVTYWTRPGKDAGVSASLGFHPPNSNEQLWLYVWTDRAAPLSPGWHSPFQAYTLLEHQGDFTAAAQILAQDAAADAQRRTNGVHTKEQSWESPTPLPSLLPDVPTLPEQLLPAPFKRWLCDIAERFQIPLEYVAIPAVIALAAIVGRRCGVRPMRRDDWLVVPNLWGMIVGRPGVLKSPAMEEALRPLKRLATRAREQYEQAKIEAGSHDAVREARRDAIHAHLKQKAKGGASPLELEALRRELVELEQATVTFAIGERRYIVNDPTVEKLGELLHQNPQGLLLYRDELAGWLRSLDKAGREGDREFYLEAWNGTADFRVDRIGRGTLSVPALCLSILGSIQPGKIVGYIADTLHGGAGDDGLLQRFQLAVWPDIPLWEHVDRYPNREARQHVFTIFERLDTFTPQTVSDDKGDTDIPTLRFSAEAQELFNAWRAQLERRLRSGELDSPTLEAHLSKYRSLMPSLALLFHLACTVDESIVSNVSASPGRISLTSAQQAAAWCDFLAAHARRIYAGALREDVQAAHALLQRIRRREIADGETVRALYRRQWSLLRTPEVVCAGLRLLEQHHVLRIYQQGVGGQRTEIVQLNPALIAHSQE